MSDDVEKLDPGEAKAAARLCNFVTGAARLLPAHQRWIDQVLGPIVKAAAAPYVHVVGFASRRGDAAFNQRLSEQRCAAVRAAVSRHSTKVVFPVDLGKGESESGSVESSNDGFYRAVEVRVFDTKPASNSSFIGTCGPDVTSQVTAVWRRIQSDFSTWSTQDKLDGCLNIMIPLQRPKDLPQFLLKLKTGNLSEAARMCADINGWDVLPLFQNASGWLHQMPKGCENCGTPAPGDANCASDAHEAEDSCSHTVQMAGKCWLNGTVNYGTYGIMIRLCNDMLQRPSADLDAALLRKIGFPANQVPGAATVARLGLEQVFSLRWAETLIRQYKKHGPHPETDVESPLSWVKATYAAGPTGRSSLPGNRPKCECACKCTGGHIQWDYVWEPRVPRP